MDKTIAIELPDELDEVFRRQAAATGRTADELAAEWVVRAQAKTPATAGRSDAHRGLGATEAPCGGSQQRQS